MSDIRTITIDYDNGHISVENPLADITKPWKAAELSCAELVANLIGPKIIELIKLSKEDLIRLSCPNAQQIAHAEETKV